MKKLLFIILSIILVLGLVACDKEVKEYIPSYSQSEIPTTVAYANWVDSNVAFEGDENCLNLDKYVLSDFPRLPTFKFDTKEELDEFKNKYKDVFTMDYGYNEVASFNDVTANYDDEFFNNHSLILTYKNASSGSFRYGISEVTKENEILIIKVAKTNNPEIYTTDMSGWFLMAEVEKDYIKDCKEFDTQVWEEMSIREDVTDMISSEIKHVSMDDIEQIMKENNNYIILDVRTIEEFNEGHIRNAICIPNEIIGEDDIPELPDKEQLLLVYCRSGRRSKEASEKLKNKGYTNIIEFGGIIDWKGEVVKESEEISNDVNEITEFVIEVNNKELIVKIEDNSSAKALIEKLKEGNVVIDAHDYGNFEKVGSLGFELPRNDKQITTKAGDVILYQGTEITLYYDTNSWNFTKLGEVTNIDGNELKELLGEGNVTMTLRLVK